MQEEEEEKSKNNRISDLPDDVLLHIISLLGNGNTKLLSTRWRGLWNSVTVQHEEGIIYAMAIATLRFVDFAIDRGKPLNWSRKLIFHSLGSAHVLVATKTAYSRKLHLDFSQGQDDDNDDSVKWWATLMLMLSYLPCPLPKIIRLTRSICLTSLNLPTNGHMDIILWLVSNMRFIESIEIRDSKCLSDVNVLFGDHMRLMKLSIIHCLDVNSIKIRGHHLSYFHYRGRCPYIEMKAARIFGMHDVMLDLREEPMSVNVPLENLFNIAPSNIYATRYLTLYRWTFEVVIKPLLTPILGLNMLEELWWIDKSMDEENIDSLISLLQECRYLKKLFVTVDPTCYCISSSDRRKRDNQKSPNSKPLHNLELVKMNGLKHEEDELLLADRIFNISVREPYVVVTMRRGYTRKLVRGQRVFVREYDSNKLNIAHIHMGV